MTTIQQKLEAAGNRPAGFDYLRFILAAAVIAQHSVNVTSGVDDAKALFMSPLRPLLFLILPMFFALSGFLVAGSLYRCKSLISFAGLRAIRLVPALAAEVVLSAVLLGPIFSELSLYDYASHPQVHAYFLNIIGIIHVTLPTFDANPLPYIVNSQLWTVPYELECYIALSALAVLGIAWKPRFLAMAIIILQVAFGIYAATRSGGLPTLPPGRLLVICFLFGVLGYQFRSKIPHSSPIAAACLAVCGWMAFEPVALNFLAVPACYLTVYLGTFNPRRIKFILSGDYSYGMYLYGFPLQQLVVAVWPGEMSWLTNILVSLPLAFLIAHFSWYCIEKPSLAAKGPLLRLEGKVLAILPSLLKRRVTAVT